MYLLLFEVRTLIQLLVAERNVECSQIFIEFQVICNLIAQKIVRELEQFLQKKPAIEYLSKYRELFTDRE